MYELTIKHKIGYAIIVLTAIGSIFTLLAINPIVQDSAYHSFADQRNSVGIQNFWNVISNLPFLIIGLLAINKLKKHEKINWQLLVFFIGVGLVAFGSGYYHFEPNNETLVWDRLPMTVAFMGLFSFVISDYLDEKTGQKLLLPLLVLGFLSILYWVKYDDLRLYAFVQFFPLVVIPVILIFFKKATSKNQSYWMLLLFYLIAKIFEYFDVESFDAILFISGHSLKHLFAALGIYFFYKLYFKNEH